MERLYQAIFDTALDAIFVIDTRGTIRSANPAAARLFGYALPEMIGRNVALLMTEPDASQHDTYLARYCRTGKRHIIGTGREVMARKKDATVFPVHLSVAEFAQDEGRMYVGLLRDISARVAAEAALREREVWLRSILATLPDALVVVDAQGLICSFSSAAETLFGYRAADMLGRDAELLLPPAHRADYHRAVAALHGTGERPAAAITRTSAGLRADGSSFPMEISVGEMWPGGRQLLTVFLRDLTELRRNETRLAELQSELLHATRLSTMGRMASTIAHEINQPLTAIANYVGAARQMMANPALSGRLGEALDKAAAQAERAGMIIQRLRDFVARGRTERRVEDLSRIVQEGSGLGLIGAAEAGIAVAHDLAPGLPPVCVDKLQIQQVVLNLVRNAVEALREAPERRITIAASPAAEPGMLEVSVSDTGPGLAPEVQRDLFKPFVSTKPQGMGLGLSICREIVEGHGGQLTATASEGGGVRFRFTLPTARADAALAEAAADA